MKQLILFSFAALIFASCTKTKTNTITVTKTDSITVTKYDTIIVVKIDTSIKYSQQLTGSWAGLDSSQICNWPTFETDILQTVCSGSIKYAASSDSIYFLGSNKVYFTQYFYHLSSNSDTLYLTNVRNPSFPIFTYYKTH